MKFLLVNPYFKGVVTVPSLGLGFMGTYMRNHSDCQIEIIEPKLQGLTEAQVLDKARASDIVGLMCYTESRFQVFNFAEKVKQANPNCKLIVGGPHVNTLDELILKHYSFIDVVVRGEGEETVLDILKDKPFKEISGITWRNNGKIVRNPDRPMIKNIDNLFYDYSLVSSQVSGWKDAEIPCKLREFNSLPIITSRGCPFRCSFCAAHKQWGNIWRGLSPEELVSRIEYLVKQYGVKYFRFYDALFSASDERILNFCDLLERNGLNISFRIDIRVGTRKDILERLREVGCEVVGFGIESGSDRILKRVNKGITRKQIEETITLCKELDYWVIGFFMVSLPDETMEDIKRTFELLKFFDVVNVQFFKIHPNTSFYDELKQKGEIEDEVWFDPNYGFNTEYGNEVFYSKEMFPSANFYRDEIDPLIGYAYRNHVTHNLSSLFQLHGKLTKSMSILFRSIAKSVLLKNRIGRRIYRKLKTI